MKYLPIIFCTFCSFLSVAQTRWIENPSAGPGADYPTGYFRNPLDIPIKLAANFGELRANHYHMGLDIRTQQKENLPVMAAADGYVSKVVIEPGGFGQAIYIRHPNGYTTLYAHLNRFYPALATYVDADQYRLQSWQVSLDIPPGLFPVKKGMFIALSGNRGGSQGPHLHFEIRRTSDDTNLNPLLFGMPVPDDVPPVILRLAIYDRSLSTYEQSPRVIGVHRVPDAADSFRVVDSTTPAAAVRAGYSISPNLITVPSSRISFAISAFDSQSGSTNPNGIFQAILYEDGQPLTGFRMDDISYNDTRKINAHIDYRTHERGGPWLQHLSRLPGYTAPTIYESMPLPIRPAAPVTGLANPPADGVPDLADGLPHSIDIEVKDASGNTAGLSFKVQYRPAPSSDVQTIPLPGRLFSPGMLDAYEGGDVAFYIGENSLYDNVHIGCTMVDSARDGLSPVYAIGSTVIPLQAPLLVRLQLHPGTLPAEKGKIVMVRTAGVKKDVVKPEWLGDWASGHFREFGNFQLVEDKQAPVITPIGIREGAILTRAHRIAFRVKDDLGSIQRFRAELDGHWLCFSNDKYLDFIYDFDKHCPRGKHLLRVTAEDVAGNSTTKEYRFQYGPEVRRPKDRH
jgi:hypothetical protein